MDRGRRRRFKLKLKPAGYAFFGAVLLLVGVGVFLIVRAIARGGSGEDLAAGPTPTSSMNLPSPSPSPTATLPPLTVTAPVVQTAIPGPVVVTPALPENTPVSATATPSSSIRKATADEKKNAQAGFVTGDDVNLRVGPSTDYKSIGKYSKNAALLVYARDGSFYFVKMGKDDKVGFISRSFVELGETSQATEIVAAPSGTVLGTVTASKVALRDDASKTSTVLTELHSGDQVHIYSRKGDFYYVQSAADGKKGYAFASYIAAAEALPAQE